MFTNGPIKFHDILNLVSNITNQNRPLDTNNIYLHANKDKIKLYKKCREFPKELLKKWKRVRMMCMCLNLVTKSMILRLKKDASKILIDIFDY